DADLLDLARLATRPWPNVPAGTTGSISVSDPAAGFVHLFKHNADDSWTIFDPAADMLSADDLKAGVTFGIEATDIVRDRDVWDGMAHVTFTAAGKSDVVALRVAPVITRHHLDKANKVFVAAINDPGSTDYRTSLKDGLSSVLGSLPTGFYNEVSQNDQW